VVGALGLGREDSVLDLGAGTGKLSRALVSVVGGVVAVEPSQPMLDSLRRRLPSVDARIGVAEDIPLGGRSVAAVFVAEAFHWFRTEQAAREIVRVLVPDGHLVLVSQRRRWWDRDSVPWIAELEHRLQPFWESSAGLAGEHPNVAARWRTDLDRLGLFDPFSSFEEEFVHRLCVDDFLAFVASWSWLAILPPAERHQALAAVSDLFDSEQELALAYCTEFQYARVRSTASPAQRAVG
jgi:SAM-dependent methyltransferase